MPGCDGPGRARVARTRRTVARASRHVGHGGSDRIPSRLAIAGDAGIVHVPRQGTGTAVAYRQSAGRLASSSRGVWRVVWRVVVTPADGHRFGVQDAEAGRTAARLWPGPAFGDGRDVAGGDVGGRVRMSDPVTSREPARWAGHRRVRQSRRSASGGGASVGSGMRLWMRTTTRGSSRSSAAIGRQGQESDGRWSPRASIGIASTGRVMTTAQVSEPGDSSASHHRGGRRIPSSASRSPRGSGSP